MKRHAGGPRPGTWRRALPAALAGLALAACAAVEQPAAERQSGEARAVSYRALREWNLKAEHLSPRGQHPAHAPLRPGFRYVLERADHPGGFRRVESVVLEQTEPFDIAGLGRFECAVVQIEELSDGRIERQVHEWVAVDTTTHAVYTFGAVSWEIDSLGGKVFAGMWRAAEDEGGRVPEPAMVVPGRFVRGERDRSAGRGSGADGYLEVMESGIEVTVPAGTFSDCVRIREHSLADSSEFTDRWWCPRVGLVLHRGDGALVASDALRSDLSAFGRHHRRAAEPAHPAAMRISAEQAQAIALKEVPGTFRSIVIERRGTVDVYTVEIIAARDGVETDVFIDLVTGKVIATER